MRRRYFLVRSVNILLIAALVFAYQMIALDRQDKEAAALEKVKQQQAEQRKASGAAAFRDGEYTGSAEGYGGAIEMRVTVSGGAIEKIDIVSASGEDAQYLNMAKGVIPEIIESQSPDVDTVSGATYSSTGIINGVTAALRKAAGQ